MSISRTGRAGRAAAALLLAGALAAAPGVAHAASASDRDDGVDVIAHRGSSGVAPENSAAAVDLAVRQRSHAVEIDVQRTADGQLVNFHDCTMERTTDVEQRFPGRPSYRVSDFTWAEIATLDAGSWFDGRYAGEPVITVAEVVRRLEHTRTGLLAEISPCAHYEGLVADFAAELRGMPRSVERALHTGRLAVQSFELDDAREFHRLLPEVPIGLLDAERPTDAELMALSSWADQVNPRATVTDQALVDRIHELGMRINVWTVDEPGQMRAMIGLGVDGIITDFPQSLTQR